jgi:hypothetical protein
MPGLDPGIHPSSRKVCFEEDGSPGQSPVMTISIGMTALQLNCLWLFEN